MSKISRNTFFNLLGCSSTGLLGCSSTGLLGCSSTGLLGCSFTGLLGCSSTGLLGCSSTGLLGCSSTGLLGCSSTGFSLKGTGTGWTEWVKQPCWNPSSRIQEVKLLWLFPFKGQCYEIHHSFALDESFLSAPLMQYCTVYTFAQVFSNRGVSDSRGSYSNRKGAQMG